MMLSLDAIQLDCYSRHIIMDEVSLEGQGRLLSSRVVVVGAGGSGVPTIQYLAAVGIDELVMVDDDVVGRSNLQRQVVHYDDDVGTPKAENATAFVREFNPDVSAEPIKARIDKSDVHEVAAGPDVVVDASDNFPTCYLLNDVCRFERVPLIHGVICKFEGQATTLVSDEPRY